MRKTLFMTILVALVSSVANSQEYAPNQVLVSFHDKTVEIFGSIENRSINCIFSEVGLYLNQHDIKSISECYHGPKGVRNIYLIEFDENVDVILICTELQAFPEIKSASPNYKVEFLGEPNDFYYNNDYWAPDPYDTVRCKDQWHLGLVQADKAWRISRGDSTVKVAIIDTGVDYFHPDLMNNIWVNPGEDLDADGVVWDVDDLNGNDDDGNGKVDDLLGWDFEHNDNIVFPDTMIDGSQHGTCMASVCAVTNNDAGQDTSMAGIVWYCKIIPIKGAYVTELGVDAINYAINIGVDVINMSWGYPSLWGPFTAFYETLQRADSLGIMLVAGEGESQEYTYCPAMYPEVIAVTGVDENGVKAPQLGYRDYVDICGVASPVHGREMTVTTINLPRYPYPYYFPGADPPHTYWYMLPSASYAVAQVSAVAALLRSVYPDSSTAFLKHELLRGAIPVDEANEGQPWEGLLGAGRINPYRSLTQWGHITSNTTWQNAVYVSADVVVDSAKTLTIEPGTTVYVAADDNGDLGTDPARVILEVRGTLIANGTAESPIVFKSFAESPEPETWYGISFTGEGAYGSLSHCRVENAKWGIKRDLDVNVDFDECEVVWDQWAHVSGDLWIDEGVTLTVEPGTEVSVSTIDSCSIMDSTTVAFFI